LECRIVLPNDSDAFFASKGPQSSPFAAERQHPRYDYRGKALLVHRNTFYPIYMKDISHSSVGFLHFEQLFPLDAVRLYLSNGTKFDVIVRRCLRLKAQCFECGGQIDATDRINAKYLRELFNK
jgi:hypothetical protein